MKRGDIYFVDLDPVAGREQRGHKPIIIVSPAAFNSFGLRLIAPVTNGGNFARYIGFDVPLVETRNTGIILCNQLRTIDIAARNGRFVEAAPNAVVEEMLARVATLVG